MKKFCALTVIVFASIGLTQVVSAGPEPTGKEMKQVAPAPPPPCPSWTGFEIGGFGAYSYGQIDTHLDLTGEWEEFHDAEVAIQNRGNRSLNSNGGEIGGFIGYNYQFAGNWVIGAEFDGGKLFQRDSKEVQFFARGFEDELAAEVSIKDNYLLTFGGKLGYAFCNWMPYFTGGGAAVNVDFSGRLVEVGTERFLEGGTSNTRTGWFVGGGVEYMLTHNWRLRAQYQYIDLGETGFTRTFGNPADPFISHRSVDVREDNVQFAIIYAF
jgi:outer membrane immunogenic protein